MKLCNELRFCVNLATPLRGGIEEINSGYLCLFVRFFPLAWRNVFYKIYTEVKSIDAHSYGCCRHYKHFIDLRLN